MKLKYLGLYTDPQGNTEYLAAVVTRRMMGHQQWRIYRGVATAWYDLETGELAGDFLRGELDRLIRRRRQRD